MMKLPKLNLSALNPRGRQPGSTLLGLSFDGSRLDAALVRRTNGSVEIQKSFTAQLSLDPLTNAPELVGRELRKLLDEHGINERWCTVCLPLNWALTLTAKNIGYSTHPYIICDATCLHQSGTPFSLRAPLH